MTAAAGACSSSYPKGTCSTGYRFDLSLLCELQQFTCVFAAIDCRVWMARAFSLAISVLRYLSLVFATLFSTSIFFFWIMK